MSIEFMHKARETQAEMEAEFHIAVSRIMLTGEAAERKPAEGADKDILPAVFRAYRPATVSKEMLNVVI